MPVTLKHRLVTFKIPFKFPHVRKKSSQNPFMVSITYTFTTKPQISTVCKLHVTLFLVKAVAKNVLRV